jgi:hypothetical protein
VGCGALKFYLRFSVGAAGAVQRESELDHYFF